LINLASGNLQIVPVLYLVLHQGAGLWTQQVVFFKEMFEQRSINQVLGRKSRRNSAKSYHGETMEASLFPSPDFMTNLQQNFLLKWGWSYF
jgi:hypothetical protein